MRSAPLEPGSHQFPPKFATKNNNTFVHRCMLQVQLLSASGLAGRNGSRLFASTGGSGLPLRRTSAKSVADGKVQFDEALPFAAPGIVVLWDNTLLAPEDYAAAAEIALNVGQQIVDLHAPTGEKMGKLEVRVLKSDAQTTIPKRSSEADVAALVRNTTARPERDIRREMLAMKSKWMSSASADDLQLTRHSSSGGKKEKKEKKEKKDKSGAKLTKEPSSGEVPVDLSNYGLDAFPILPPGVALLDLSFNLLTSISTPSLASLGTLNLNANRITTLTLSSAPLLRELYLRANTLTQLTISAPLSNLSVLDLGDNRLASLPDAAGLPALTHLLLDGNDLRSICTEISHFHLLHTLDVSRCRLTSLPPSVSQLVALKSLYAHANALTFLPVELGSLTALRLLRLSGNPLRHIPLQLCRCLNLELIDLKNTALPQTLLEAAEQGGAALKDLLKQRLEIALQTREEIKTARDAALLKVKEKHRHIQASELGHTLVVRHVTSRRCDACDHTIGGLGRNALACVDCGVVAHRKCAAHVYPSCEPLPTRAASLSSFPLQSAPLSGSLTKLPSGSATGSRLVRPVAPAAPRLVSLRSDSRILKRAVETNGNDQKAAEELAERLVRLCEDGVAADLEVFLSKAAQQSTDLPALLLRAHAAEANAPVHLLAYGGRAEALLIAIKFDPTVVSLRSGHGLMPLHLAAQMGRANVLKVLLSNGAEVNARELQGGHTALHLAAERGHVDCVTLLLGAGADPALGSYTGRTALDKALLKRQNEVVALLEELCARAQLPPLRSAATDSVPLLGVSVNDPLTWLRSGQSVLLDAFQVIRSDFELFDANGDGCVSWQELSSAYARLASAADTAELQRVFHAADADGSSSIERAEFTWLVYAWVQSAAIDSIFLMRDNGPLLRQAFKLLERAFTQADADNSGEISTDELRLFLSHLNGIYPPLSEQELAHRLRSLRLSPPPLLNFREFVSVLEAWPLPEPLPIVVDVQGAPLRNHDKAAYAVLDTISLHELMKAIGVAVSGQPAAALSAILPPRDHRRELKKESDWAATVVAFKNRRSAASPFLRLVLTVAPPPRVPSPSPSSSGTMISQSKENSTPSSAPTTSTGGTPRKPGKLLGMSLDLKVAATTESTLVAGLKSPMRAKEIWEINPDEVQQGKALGAGAYGSVYAGTYKGEHVAVKRLTNSESGKAPDDLVLSAFISEIKLMARLSHPRILRFVGASLTPPNLMCLTAFMQRGSLSDVIARDNPPWLRRVHMARDGAEGLAFLHSLKPPVVHRDVKSMNLLVDAEWRVVVADFGTSEALETEANRHAARWGTLNWMPPEVFNGQIYDLPSDVFSFGMVLWECLTGAIPFGHIANPLQVLQLIEAGERPPIPPSADASFAALIRSCWLPNPELRPAFSEVIAKLDAIAPPTPSE